ncbi:fibrous sheath CABYR-binding protein-like [Ornithodoros turicata]|uniref:fibrous sheath CABYR-binding protein-like n=1 Tax=Ornithodoros turicata TaxID=34597 RepID=UPI0031396717
MDASTFISMLCSNKVSCSKLRTCMATERAMNTWQIAPSGDVIESEPVLSDDQRKEPIKNSTATTAATTEDTALGDTDLPPGDATTPAAPEDQDSTTEPEAETKSADEPVNEPLLAPVQQMQAAESQTTKGASVTPSSDGSAAESATAVPSATTIPPESSVPETDAEPETSSAPETSTPSGSKPEVEEYPEEAQLPADDAIPEGEAEDVDLYPCLCARRVRRKYRQNSRRNRRSSDWRDYHLLFPLAAVRECLVTTY